MRSLPQTGLSIFVMIGISIGLLLPGALQASEKIRKPAVAGLWYPSEPGELLAMLTDLDHWAAGTAISLPQGKTLKALIMPHAGFVYSGWTAAHAGRLLKTNQFQKVILMGPDHRVGFRDGAISAVDAYQTPLGRIPLHPDAAAMRAASAYFHAVKASDRLEHSLEAVIPFLQFYLKTFQMIPMVVGSTNSGQLADALMPYLDTNTLLVVSSDLSHYLSYDQARQRDDRTIRSILALDARKLASDRECACGRTPILVLLHIARKFGWQPVLLHYSNSGDTGKDRSRVVGYAAIAFFGEPDMEHSKQADTVQRLTASQDRALINLARLSIREKLGLPNSGSSVVADPEEPCYQVRCGTFVTLKKSGRLRGCIGNFGTAETLYNGIRKNAQKAAFSDPRFAPVSAHELSDLEISISILSNPLPLAYKDGMDLKTRLRPNIDGVIISKGQAGATFLPQVWQQLPLADDFLSHLCMKAGLAVDAWQNTPLEVFTYQVQHFE